MKQNISGESGYCVPDQEIYGQLKSLSLRSEEPITAMCPETHTLTFSFSKVRFNIILPFEVFQVASSGYSHSVKMFPVYRSY